MCTALKIVDIRINYFRENEHKSTYCHIMKRGPWRAVHFDWHFGVDQPEKERKGLITERLEIRSMAEKLNFTIYPSAKNILQTRNLTKPDFLRELHRFKELCASEPCGCILMTISSHGEIVKTDDQGGSESFEIFEDNILTHQDSSAFSRDDSRVPVREIIEVFRDRKLKQIPKIFFIQACRAEENSTTDVDTGIRVGYRQENEFQYQDDPLNRSHSTPYLENSVMVYSTPFGYSAGFSYRIGSHVWKVLQMTLKEILAQVPVIGPVNLLHWLKETNNRLAKSEEYEIDDIEYKPLLSICHTLTRNIIFDTNNN